MGLTERRVSRANSLQMPLRHSAGGRKHNAKHQTSLGLKVTGIFVLAMAGAIAVLGIWHVENLGITPAGLRMQAPAAANKPRPALSRFRNGFKPVSHSDPSLQQGAAASAAAYQHSITSAPFPDELPLLKPDPVEDQHDDDIVNPPAQPASRQQQAAAVTPSAPLPQQQQQQQAAAIPSAPFPQQQQEQTPYTYTYAPNPSAAAAAAAELPKNRLLLSTHSRLMWYFPDTDEYLVLHEGEGVHYGAFPGGQPNASPDRKEEAATVWTAVRPHNWRPATNKEYLVEMDAVTGAEVRRVPIPSRFTHDVVRVADSVFVCDTGNGRILQLSYPDMLPIRSLDLFTLKDHPNTLAPLGPDNFLVVLHNLGESDIVRVNISATPLIDNPEEWLAAESQKLLNPGFEPATSRNPTGLGASDTNSKAIIGRVQRVGEKAHGLVPWQGAYIMLDSDNGTLIALDLTEPGDAQGFKLHKLWQAPEQGVFLKGLAVIDDIAYFGISPQAPRSARDDPRHNNDLAAFDLISGNLLWRRTVPTAGLLNTVSAPHLSVGSTYLPSYTGRPETEAVKQHHSSEEVAWAMESLVEIGYPPKIGGYWSSGLPYLNANIKATKRPWEAGLQLPLLMLNISKLQAAVAGLPAEAWTYEYQAKHSAVMAGREGNQAAFKPGVEGIVLLFSANDGHGPVYKFPAYEYFKDALEPLLEEIVGKRDMQHIIRLQLALMKPGVSDIKIHVDSGGYAIRGHRIHIPVFTHPDVSFDVCPHRYQPDPEHIPGPGEQQRMLDIQECYKIPTVEGFVFELNNRAAHKVSNLSPIERVHVVFDLCEEPHPRVDVPRGTVCDYDMEQGLICKYPDGLTPAVMAPAYYMDPAAAAAEGAALSLAQQQQQLEDESVQAPTPDLGSAQLPQINFDQITNIGLADQAAGIPGSSSSDLISGIRNGQADAWVAEAMQGSQAGLSAV